MLTRYKEDVSHILPFLICFSLFLLGLNLPQLSIAVSLFVFPIILYTLSKKDLCLKNSDLIINVLLLGFSISYYITLWMHGYIELVKGLRYILAIQVFYLLGHYSFIVFRKKNADIILLKPVIFICLGFSIFAITATLFKSIETSKFFIGDTDVRRVSVPWNVSEIHATILAVYCSLGVSLFPVVLKLISFKNKIRYVYFYIGAIFFMAVTGVISSLMFSNRSTFIMIIFLFLIVTCYFVYLRNRGKNLLWFKLFLVGVVFFAAYYILFISGLSYFNHSEIPLLKRFTQNILGDPRFKLWWLGLQNLGGNFFGGKTYSLTTYAKIFIMIPNCLVLSIFDNLAFLNPDYYQYFYYKSYSANTFDNVHNLWLDIHYLAGLIPFCFIIIFHSMHIKCFLRLIFQKKINLICITALCIGVALFMYFMIEPIMKCAPRYFMASCFLLAYFRQISIAGYKSKDCLNNLNSA